MKAEAPSAPGRWRRVAQLRYAIPLVASALLLVFLGIGLTLDPREVPSPLIGKPA